MDSQISLSYFPTRLLKLVVFLLLHSLKSVLLVQRKGQLKELSPLLTKIKDLNLGCSCTLDTDNTGEIEFELSDVGIDNSNLKITLTQAIVEKQVETTVEQKWSVVKDNFALQLGGSGNIESTGSVSAFGTIAFQKPENIYWSLSGNTEIGKDKKVSLSEIDGKLARVTENSEALFNVNWKKDEMTYLTSWFQKLSPKVSYGVSFTTTVGESTPASTAVVVGEYDVDENTTVRAKTLCTTEKDGPRIGFGLSQKITPGCITTIGIDFNPKHLCGSSADGKPHSLGFEVKLI